MQRAVPTLRESDTFPAKVAIAPSIKDRPETPRLARRLAHLMCDRLTRPIQPAVGDPLEREERWPRRASVEHRPGSSMLAMIRALGVGLLGFLFPRILIGLGLPLDQWAAVFGGWIGLSRAWVAEWGIEAIGAALGIVLSAVEIWWHPVAHFWQRVRQEFASHTKWTRARSIRRDDGDQRIGGEDQRESQPFVREKGLDTEPETGSSQAPHGPDPAKRNAVDEIWNALGEVEQAYDAWLSLAQTWRQRLGTGERDELVSGLRQRREAMSKIIIKVADLCEHRYGNFEDIYQFRMSHGFGGGQKFAAN